MTNKRIAQTNQQQKSEKPQESGILQRAAVRSVPETSVQPTEDAESLTLSNSPLHQNFSRVPISTMPPQVMAKRMVSPMVQRGNAGASVQSQGEAVQRHEMPEVSTEGMSTSGVHKENKTGLPDHLKMAAENDSGYLLDDVKVHYNSDKPAQHQAYAYAQGTDIYVASGREKDVAHEVKHVLQQKEGKVQPTGYFKGVPINTDQRLEKDADEWGRKVMQEANSIRDKEELSYGKQGRKKTKKGGTKQLKECVQRTIGATERELTNEQWDHSGMSTYASIYKNNDKEKMDYLGMAKSTTSKTFGKEHAEDVAIRVLLDNWDDFEEEATNHLVIAITKSPCTREKRNGDDGNELPATTSKEEEKQACAEVLIDLQKKGLSFEGKTKKFQLDVITRGLYAPNIPTFTQKQVLAASQKALDAMTKAGINVRGDQRDSRFGVQERD